VLVGIFVAHKFRWIDSVLGFIIALMLFYAVFEILKEAITKILGEKPDQKLIDDISSLIQSIYKDDLNMHHFHIHNYVTHKEITFHIRLKGDVTIGRGHIIVSEIENKILEKFNMVATIRVEPLTDDLMI